jgi:tetrahydromethanopterin S-methyltransferase subunit H
LKTYPGASSEKDGVLQDDAMKTSKVVMKSKQGHRKASTVSGQIARGAQYHNMPQTFKKLRETKETAENAMKVCLLARKTWRDSVLVI